ncbi:MAG: GNAT family N-acetyltransferase [Clostridium sp.]|nr:GNAT family N-acetyltransferase [Clostridium sp.]
MKIRKAEIADAEELLSIYKYYVENTDITFEYDTPTVEEFADRIGNTLKKYPYLVAEEEGSLDSSENNDSNRIIGYAYAGAFKARRAYDWSVETSIYVRHGAGSHGIGTSLYNELERYLKEMNIINVNACITYPNETSEAFHEKFGYKTVAHFTKCGYKFGQWKDMIWMEKMIGEHKDKPEEVIPFPEL